MEQYRHELKYLCSEAQLTVLEARIAPLMRRDSHETDPAGYWIRSLYFDDIDDACYLSNQRGLSDRVKLRIRYYNRACDTLRLEAKYKHRGLSRKESCPVDKALCERLLAGERLPLSAETPKPLRLVALAQQTRLLRPRLIVAYRRIAYTLQAGHVRVTFDRNIGSSERLSAFLQPDIPMTPLLPPGQQILEVKYDGFIPDYLLQAMEIGSLMQYKFSKYATGREATDLFTTEER